MKLSSVKIYLLAVYFLVYGALGCFFPYIAVYFKYKGLTYMQTGMAFSTMALTSIVAQPIMGYLADKFLSKKQVVLINMFACSLLIYLYVVAGSFYSIIFAIVALILFQSSVMSITDAYCYDIADKNPEVNYGQARLMGSMGFAIFSLLLGSLIQRYNINISFFLYSILFLLSALILSGIKYKSTSNIARPTTRDIVEVLKNYRFILFVLSVMIINIVLSAHSSFIAVLVEATGGNVANLGIVWFVSSFSELPAFFFGSRLLKKHGELNIFITAMALYAIRMLLSAYSTSYTMVICVQLLQSITYPLYLFATMQYINKIVPDKIRASGITMLSSLGFGLGGLIGSLGGGFILQNSNPFFLYKTMAAVCLAALVVALYLKFKDGKLQTSVPGTKN